MKKVVAILMMSLFATSAFAVVDDAVNSMGIYFDLNADVYEANGPMYVAFNAYVIVTNPDFGALFGYEFGYEVIGNCSVMGTTLAGTGPIDVGDNCHIVGLAAPLATSPATVVTTLSVFPMSADPISFELKGALPNSIVGSNVPALLLEGDVIIPAGLSAGLTEEGDTQICAYINGWGVVATDEASWDEVKSLYR